MKKYIVNGLISWLFSVIMLIVLGSMYEIETSLLLMGIFILAIIDTATQVFLAVLEQREKGKL